VADRRQNCSKACPLVSARNTTLLESDARLWSLGSPRALATRDSRGVHVAVTAMIAPTTASQLTHSLSPPQPRVPSRRVLSRSHRQEQLS